MKNRDIIELLQTSLKGSSKSEKLIVRYFLSNFPFSALGNLSTISAKCKVSVATVQRCTIKLGFNGFPDFHSAVITSLEDNRLSSPLQRLKNENNNYDNYSHGTTEYHYQQSINNIIETFEGIDNRQMEEIVKLLSDKNKSIWCLGGRFTGVLTTLFARNLKTLRQRVREYFPYNGAILDVLIDCNKDTVLFITDIRRYDPDLLNLVKLVSEKQKSTVILLTDTWGSPIKRYATITIPVLIGTDACWDSNIAMLSVIEELMGRITTHLDLDAKRQLELREGFLQKMEM